MTMKHCESLGTVLLTHSEYKSKRTVPIDSPLTRSFGHRPVEFVIVRDKSRIRELAACKSLGGSQIIGADAVIALNRGKLFKEEKLCYTKIN